MYHKFVYENDGDGDGDIDVDNKKRAAVFCIPARGIVINYEIGGPVLLDLL